MSEPALLIEIGCEEIPSRMVPGAAEDLGEILQRILDQASLKHGKARPWGGSRRLAVHVDAVQERQADREELLLGPPAKVAFDDRGRPTRAAEGFARKQGVEASELAEVETEKGRYAGIKKLKQGASLGQILARELPPAVEGMSFAKTMRWGDGTPRWVRPVHWVLALHGGTLLPLELFGVASAAHSMGHRFLAGGPVTVSAPDAYEKVLESARVVADPARRRELLSNELERAARNLGGSLIEDPALLEEVADLVEWPGVVEGRIDPSFLELPRELLVTTLRHHQKCFSLQGPENQLLPAFLAVANTDSDPRGHIRRGNEWVVGGRLEDARFFWREDRKRRLAERAARLESVVFHAKLGSYADKAGRMERLARELARHLSMGDVAEERCAEAARLAKGDLVTGTVGEFPELQGKVGGLLLAAEGEPEEIARAVYSHYQPTGPEDGVPPTEEGCVVSVADKLDSVAGLIEAGELPTGSRDPFATRRASSGVFRIALERAWPVSLRQLTAMAGGGEACLGFLMERLQKFLLERGATVNEIRAVLRPRVDPKAALDWALPDIRVRLEALRTVRQRPDFAHLADLTKRVDNILTKGREIFDAAVEAVGGASGFVEDKSAALDLAGMIPSCSERIDERSRAGDYRAVVDLLAEFVDPVEKFFVDVLVLDPKNPKATLHRKELLAQLSGALTRCFDIRELAGQAERR
jgi:glycyl-tRNA synthetase beta chain